ncbi:hypothetical protein OG225_41915 (plasmid) [Nocardia sp. NBC_01377]|uniref:hypothetical protein n=1 Tax=Nocardia sp. NBC_01377 TaxID=2903595 RepID=UPI003246463F
MGFQYAHGTNWFDTKLASDFAVEYALGVAEFLAEQRTILPPIPEAWSAWRAGNDIAEPPPALSPQSPANQIPDDDQYAHAVEEPIAELIGFEAFGYATGWCDASGLGSSAANDFGCAVTVLVAAHMTRLDMAEAWRNWRTGRPIAVPPRGGDVARSTESKDNGT